MTPLIITIAVIGVVLGLFWVFIRCWMADDWDWASPELKPPRSAPPSDYRRDLGPRPVLDKLEEKPLVTKPIHLTSRLDNLEERVTALEKGMGTVGNKASGVTAIARRVTALEERADDLAEMASDSNLILAKWNLRLLELEAAIPSPATESATRGCPSAVEPESTIQTTPASLPSGQTTTGDGRAVSNWSSADGKVVSE